MRRLVLMLTVLGVLLAMGASARADQVQFYLNTDEHGDSTPPAGTVLVTVATTGTGATVTFQAESVGSTQYYLNSVFLNATGSFTATATGIPSAGSQSYNVDGVGGLDSYGQFTENITPSANDPSTKIVVTLTGSWADAAAVLAPTCDSALASCGSIGYSPTYYSHGFLAAATVGTDSAAGSSHSNDDADVAGFTPEPSSMLLFGSGLLALGGFFRKRLGLV